MEDIKQWCLMISAVSIISGIILYLVPSCKLKGAYSFLSSILLVYTLITPSCDNFLTDFDLSDYFNNDTVIEEFSDNTFMPAESIVNSEIAKSIRKLLQDNGFDAECTVISTIEKDSLNINEISISGKFSNDEKSYITELLSDYKTKNTKINLVGDVNE